MGPLGVVEVGPIADNAFGIEAVGQLVQVDRLVLEGAPQTFDEDVVLAPVPAIHGDADTGVAENAGKIEAGKLAALIRVEDLGPAVSSQRFLQRGQAKSFQ